MVFAGRGNRANRVSRQFEAVNSSSPAFAQERCDSDLRWLIRKCLDCGSEAGTLRTQEFVQLRIYAHGFFSFVDFILRWVIKASASPDVEVSCMTFFMSLSCISATESVCYRHTPPMCKLYHRHAAFVPLRLLLRILILLVRHQTDFPLTRLIYLVHKQENRPISTRLKRTVPISI
jgi:hypothetical protein